ncbi:fungal specific transcription factor domain protein [Rhizoctonia solani AG-3 Rhs1AP]|uniref:Fungal specific transcription factor domain protein n=1 Tax=Rhizoctonia solani AG-3 Rhs1AP TaxID=1086054 RepID=X8JKN5_9AGAM|nr:fungal specific transcription factor domain protein [Rhizoctonia solani AG-3 Rhs1AP]
MVTTTSTSYPTQTSAPAKTRACATCRASKHRCDGSEHSTNPCSRCTRAGKPCVWPEKKPMGRPRKHVLTVTAENLTRVSQAPSSSTPSPSSDNLQLLRSPVAQSSPTSISDYFLLRGSSPSVPRPRPTGRDLEIRNLIDKYFAIPHHFVPVLRPRHEFLLNLPTTHFLTTCILAFASRYAYRTSANDYRELALSQATVTNEATERPIEYAQAMLLLTYLEYGLGNVTNAASLNKQAIEHIVHLGWHTLDRADGPACTDIFQGAAGGLISLKRGWNGIGNDPSGPEPPESQSATDKYKDNRCEERRRLVWELWIQDLLLSITSGTPRYLAESEFAVHFPRDTTNPAFPSLFYPLRIKSFIKYSEALMLDTFIDNASLEGLQTWSDAVKGMNDQDTKVEWQTVRTTCFMSLLVLNAAMIHLHHRYAIPNLHFNFNVCSVAPTASGLAALAAIANGSYPMQPTPTDDTPPLQIPPTSVAKITTSSRSILTLFRDSQRAALSQSIPTLHPPAGDALTGPADVTPAQMDDILRQSPFCGCSQVIACFGSAIEVATAGEKYQALAAYSNLETATHILKRLKSLWPVAGAYEEELTKCHTAVQSALQDW